MTALRPRVIDTSTVTIVVAIPAALFARLNYRVMAGAAPRDDVVALAIETYLDVEDRSGELPGMDAPAARKCSPHQWAAPALGDEALTCETCGRVLPWWDLTQNMRGGIHGAVQRHRGDAVAASFMAWFCSDHGPMPATARMPPP